MKAHFEPLVGVIRVFHDGKTYGDRYEWAATCRFLTIDRVEILGVTRPPTPSMWRAIKQEFGEMGVKTIVFVRKRADGANEEHEVRVNSSQDFRNDQ